MEAIGGWLFWVSVGALSLYAVWARRNRPRSLYTVMMIAAGYGDWRERLWAAHYYVVRVLLALALIGVGLWMVGEQRKGDAACIARGGEPHHLGRGGFLCAAPGSTR